MHILRLIFIAAAVGMLSAGCSSPDTRDTVGGDPPDGGFPTEAEPLNDGGLPTYKCRSATGPVKIDGLLDDAAWKDAPFSARFIRRRYSVPDMPPNIRTRMKMLHDKHNLYVGVECSDSDIWSTFTERDDPVMFEEAAVVFVDPLGNGRDYYGFYVNPLNAMLDLKLPSSTLEMRKKIWLECTRWNGEGIEHAVQVDGTVNKRNDEDSGWTLEIKLPFDTLGVRPMPGDSWRVQVGRIKKPRMSVIGVLSTWTNATVLHSAHDFGVLVFQE